LPDVVEDAVAETSRELHEAEVKILGLAFAAEVKTTDGVVATLNDLVAARK
jgi:isochorismate hydrolase